MCKGVQDEAAKKAIYCDTDSLLHNIQKNESQPKCKAELEALPQLLSLYYAGHITMYRSAVNHRELEATQPVPLLKNLRRDYERLNPIANDVKVYGVYSGDSGSGVLGACPSILRLRGSKRNETDT